jgi:hypothetical protein
MHRSPPDLLGRSTPLLLVLLVVETALDLAKERVRKRVIEVQKVAKLHARYGAAKVGVVRTGIRF